MASVTAVMENVQGAGEPVSRKNVNGYVSYSQRWFVMLSVVLVNVANNSHWICFASVQSKAAHFYAVSVHDMQMVLTLSFSLGIPFSCVATFILTRYGLRPGLITGGTFMYTVNASLTCLGGLLCCLSTFPWLMSQFTNSARPYQLTLIGQAVTGIASPFVSSVPTKVSQHWFSEGQRTLATSVLGLSNPLGLVVGQAMTPIFVTSSEDVPLMNIIWFVPAAVGAALTILTVNRSRPPTPPSRSAELERDDPESRHYLLSLRSVACNKSYLVLVVVIGGAMGYVTAHQIKNEPILCSLGYNNSFSGMCAALVFAGGTAGSVALGYLMSSINSKNAICVAKLLCIPLAVIMLALIFIMQTPGIRVWMAVTYLLLGFFMVGLYPTLLELAVEATYPVDESIVTAILFVANSLVGLAIIHLDDVLSRDLAPDDDRFFEETCSQLVDGPRKALDHNAYVIMLNAFGMVLLLLFLACFSTELKRTRANSSGPSEAYTGSLTSVSTTA